MKRTYYLVGFLAMVLLFSCSNKPFIKKCRIEFLQANKNINAAAKKVTHHRRRCRKHLYF